MRRARPGREAAPARLRRLARLAVLFVPLLAAACTRSGAGPGGATDADLKPLPLGGDFELTDDRGERFSSSTLRGRPVLLFFGYTSCPDACPNALGRLSRAYGLLRDRGLQAPWVQTLFVSVDPGADTPEKLHAYLGYFSVPAIGLTGSEAELKGVARRFAASFERVPESSATGYRIDHSTYVYLIDGQGQVRHLFSHDDPPEHIADLTGRLLGESCCRPPRKGG